MQKSQLVNVLRTFSKKEVRDCRKWLYSPYHNQREDCRLLFEYLCEHLHVENALSKEVAHQSLFSDVKFDDAYIRQVKFFLLNSIEAFLTYDAFKKNTINSKTVLAECYRKRGLNKLYQKNLKSIRKAHENTIHRNEDFFQNELSILKEEHLGTEKRSFSINLQEISDAMDKTYLIGKLKQACLMVADQNVYKVEYHLGVLPELLEYIEKHNLLDTPAVAIYYYIYLISTVEEDESTFIKVKKLISQHTSLFSNSEASDIYLMTVNYCTIQINKGKREFISEAFKIYQLGIERKIFILDGIIDRFLFRNIVTAGAYLKEYDWLEQFTEEYQQYLDPRHKEDYVNLSKSVIHTGKKEYDKAMRLLAQYDFKDTLINLNGKAMLIKIYYELNEITALDSLLESATAFVNRKKDLTNNYKLLYNNLIKYTRKLLRVNPYDKKKREKLKQEILNANPLIEKRWFLEQLEKL